MWKTQKNNLICSYLDAYEDQKRHIERVLSAKDTTKSTKPPYYPKFLKLKACKYHMEEEKNEHIREENRILYYKIKDAIKKPSKYSKIFEPKKCPAFDKGKLLLKRIKHEIDNYQENIRFYYRIEKANSFYPKEQWIKRNKELEENSRIFQKSIFDISPNLMFSSPERIKNEIERYRNKRNNSKKIKTRPMTQRSSSHKKSNKNLNKTYTKNNSNHNLENDKNDKNQNLENEKNDKQQKLEKEEQKKEDKNYKQINIHQKNNKNKNSTSKKLSRENSESRISKKK